MWGNSPAMLRKVHAEDRAFTCDLAIVDGLHTHGGDAKADIVAFLPLMRRTSTMAIDDVNYGDVRAAWRAEVAAGSLAQTYCSNAGGRSWCWATKGKPYRRFAHTFSQRPSLKDNLSKTISQRQSLKGFGFVTVAAGSYFVQRALLALAQLKTQNAAFFTEKAGLPACKAEQLHAGWLCVDVTTLSAAVLAPAALGTGHGCYLNGRRVYKMCAMLAAPFHHAVFIDADTYPCITALKIESYLGHGRSLMDHYDILMALAHAHTSRFLPKALGCTYKGMAKVPDAFPMLNSGFIFFRPGSPKVRQLVAGWIEMYSHNSSRYDQCALRYLMGTSSSLRIMALPPYWNFRMWGSVFAVDSEMETGKGWIDWHGPCCNHTFMRKERGRQVLIDHDCRVPGGALLPSGATVSDAQKPHVFSDGTRATHLRARARLGRATARGRGAVGTRRRVPRREGRGRAGGARGGARGRHGGQ